MKRVSDAGVEYAVRQPDAGDPPLTTVWASSSYSVDMLGDRTKFKQITRDEARKLRPYAFRSPKKDKTAEQAPVPTKPGLEMANIYRKAVGTLDYKGRDKIPAIKAVRCIGDQGLAESLVIVENFEKFLAFVEEHNQLPQVGDRFASNPFTKKA
jgi:hypothetical protein